MLLPSQHINEFLIFLWVYESLLSTIKIPTVILLQNILK